MKRLSPGHTQSLALTNGEVFDAVVLAHNGSIAQHDLPLAGWQIGIQERPHGSVVVRQAEILAFWFLCSTQTVPGSFGAMLARSQLGGEPEGEREKDPPTYWGELFLMGAGALFLSFNMAPTEEMVLIAYKMSAWQSVALALVSLGLMHAFVYTLNFRGGSVRPGHIPAWSVFARFTCVGYAIVLGVSLFTLWAFGRTDGDSLRNIISASIVLGFPGAIGAASARLLL